MGRRGKNKLRKPKASKVPENIDEVLTLPEDESSCGKALRNELVLQKLFSFIPTKMLLSSCSLVNKTWNSKARKFIRDNRRCTPKLTIFPCEALRKLNEMCEQITARGRVVPFNCVKLNCIGIGCKKPKRRPGKAFCKHLTTNSEIKIKFLDVSGCEHDGDVCKFHKPLCTLLEMKGQELRVLKTDSIKLFRSLQDNNPGLTPQFPKLQVLDMLDVYFMKERPGLEESETVRWLLMNTPNLKSIVTELTELNMLPEDILARVELKLPINLRACEEKDRGPSTTSESRSDVRVLEIISTPFLRRSEMPANPGRAGVLHADENLFRHFDTLLEQTLEKHHANLKRIEFLVPYPLASLSHPPLCNLSQLKMHAREVEQANRIWNVLTSIDFELTMPNLREVDLHLETWMDESDRDDRASWPAVSNAHLLHYCTTAYKLSLDYDYPEINVPPLRALFPNLTDLSLIIGRRGASHRDLQPLKDAWKWWPRLVRLEFSRPCSSYSDALSGQNHDADFLGIHEEEAEKLREENEDFLRNVHIVPIRPCLLTMLKLRELRLHHEFFYSPFSNRDGNIVDLISNATKFVAFEKIPVVGGRNLASHLK